MYTQPNIPFLKFDIDPKEAENLRIIKYEEIEPYEPEFLYLFENVSTGNFYCVWEKDMHLSSGSDNEVIGKFIGDDFRKFTEIAPKHDD